MLACLDHLQHKPQKPIPSIFPPHTSPPIISPMSDRLTQLSKLYDADANDPFLTYGIALEHGKLGNFSEALTWLDKTVALDEHYCYAYFQQAKMHEEEGNTPQALAAIELGIQKSQACGDEKAAGELAELREMIQD